MGTRIIVSVCAVVGFVAGAAVEKTITAKVDQGHFWLMIPVGAFLFIAGYRKRDGLDPSLGLAGAIMVMLSGAVLFACGVMAVVTGM